MLNLFVVVCMLVFMSNMLTWSKNNIFNLTIKLLWGTMFLWSIWVGFELYYGDRLKALKHREEEIVKMERRNETESQKKEEKN
jgi:hypothetical protein